MPPWMVPETGGHRNMSATTGAGRPSRRSEPYAAKAQAMLANTMTGTTGNMPATANAGRKIGGYRYGTS